MSTRGAGPTLAPLLSLPLSHSLSFPAFHHEDKDIVNTSEYCDRLDEMAFSNGPKVGLVDLTVTKE